MALERVLVPTPAASGGGRVIASPFQFHVTGEDALRVRSWCAVAGVTLDVRYRFALVSGLLQISADQHSPNSDRTLKETTVALSAGYLVNLVIRRAAGTPLQGDCYVAVDIVRGLGSSAAVVGQVLGGYLTASMGLAWPGSAIASATEGPGAMHDYSQASPAAGSPATITVPTGLRWRLASVFAQLDTNGGIGGPRNPYIDAVSAGTTICRSTQSDGPGGGQRGYFTWAFGLNPQTNVGSPTAWFVQGPLPDRLTLFGGDTFVINSNPLNAGDQFSNIGYQVEQWIEPSVP